jgi:hypothetical protein
MLQLLREKSLEVFKTIVPLILVICVLQITIVQAPLPLFLQFVAGSVLAAFGMLLLVVGIDLGVLPLGRYIGAELPKKGSVVLIMAVAFASGLVTTLAEPDVLVLSTQVDSASGGAISGRSVLYVIGLGFAVLAAVAIARTVLGWPLKHLLIAAYLLCLVLAALTPPQFISLAFDGGSVTTGVLSAPIMMALAIGVSSVLAGRSSVADGFGLVGFASVGPILAVLIMGLLHS